MEDVAEFSSLLPPTTNLRPLFALLPLLLLLSEAPDEPAEEEEDTLKAKKGEEAHVRW